jgi:hypothetical protein
MEGEPVERWRTLCEQAAKEKDPDKLMALITEINQLLDRNRNYAEERPATNIHDAP